MMGDSFSEYWSALMALDQLEDATEAARLKARTGKKVAESDSVIELNRKAARADAARSVALSALAKARTDLRSVDMEGLVPRSIRGSSDGTFGDTSSLEAAVRRSLAEIDLRVAAIRAHDLASKERRRAEAQARDREHAERLRKQEQQEADEARRRQALKWAEMEAATRRRRALIAFGIAVVLFVVGGTVAVVASSLIVFALFAIVAASLAGYGMNKLPKGKEK